VDRSCHRWRSEEAHAESGGRRQAALFTRWPIGHRSRAAPRGIRIGSLEWEFGGPPESAKARQNYAKWSPHLFADRIKTATLVITNEQDFRVPVDQGLQLLTALRRNGVPAEALVFPDEGHFVLKALNSQRWHEMVFDWIRRYL
jgi:dipeptidyl aminopeptidase/acylaminoacyl peptidase